MKYEWQDLPERKNCFTVRNATMINLNTGKIVRHYSANTKIAVVQKCVTPKGTYYRTAEAVHHYLNYAFEASAFGLPNETAPPAPSTADSFKKPPKKKPSTTRAPKSTKKIKSVPKATTPKGGEGERQKGWLRRLFRRKNG